MKAIGRFARIRERSQGGFSLLELLIAIVILAIVVAVIVSGVTQLPQREEFRCGDFPGAAKSLRERPGQCQ